MNNFRLLHSLPSEWFEYKNNKWYAKTHLGNSADEKELQHLKKYDRADLIHFSLINDEFIPISIYDEHQNGVAVMKEFYSKLGINYLDYYPVFLNGINYPCTPDDVTKLKNIFQRLKQNEYNLTNTFVYIGYLTNDLTIEKITVEDFLNNNFKTEVIKKPLTKVGEEIIRAFEQFRDCFNVRKYGKYSCSLLRDKINLLYKLLKKHNLTNQNEYDNVIEKIDLYDDDEINEQQLMEALFSFNGFRNIIHNRIREKIDDNDFIKLVGNPEMLNNIMECM